MEVKTPTILKVNQIHPLNLESHHSQFTLKL